LAGSGWCHHPQRKVSSGVMILVRSNELACRDDWSRSLWAPADDEAEADDAFRRPSTLGPAAPANLQDMRSLVNANTTVPSTPIEGEDVLLSEGRIISENHKPPIKQERPVATGGFDPRTAVFKAREAYRERSRAKEAAARQRGGAEAIVVPPLASHPVRFGEASPSSVGAGAEARLQEPPDRDRPPNDEPLLQVAANVQGSEMSLPTARFQPAKNGEATAHAPTSRTSSANGMYSGEEVEVTTAAPPAGQPHEAVASIDRAKEPAELALPEWFRTDLPRICRTCRDYRPSAEGGRGWCANAWAFTHRTLVREDDPAPCDSSIGDWWVPVDDVWLVAADVSAHGRATPLLDRLSGQERGRRRS
jgi:hypothetical protein